ncbi:MAG: penicillin-binding transpeptidase domain-containing protein, partial [Proteobacteria bacterium]|nr:penicillin-binding transpeptidase domain-containing protein [Pseudomonadota bacterium]
MRTITTIEFDGTGKRVIDNAKNRVVVTIVLFSICFLVIAGRLVDLGLLGGEARADHMAGAAAIGQSRGDIVDRNGVLLATDLDVISIGAERHKVPDPADVAIKIASVLTGIVPSALEQELRAGPGFIWIKRKLAPAEFDAVNRLGIPGLEFRKEVKRVYPQGSLAAHLVGYADIDGKGVGGIERYFEQKPPGAEGGPPLQLAIDVRVQHALRDQISFSISRFGATGGAGLVLDVRTGEVVAMTSLPDFNPNKPGQEVLEKPFMNRITHGVYEMGSTFKTFTVAMALEKGVIKLGDGYDATKPIRISRFTIRDDHPQARWLTVPEIFMYSSNIGSAKMAMDAGACMQRSFLGDLGLLRRPEIELFEVGIPQVPDSWGDISTMTIAYGHGLA